MSSPLSSLGKLRKVSLHLPELQGRGKQVVCFEENYTDDEAALLSEILPLSWAHSPISSNHSPPTKSKANGFSPGDNELMSTMMKRLTKMEQRVQSQALEISRKNQQIAVLEEKLSVLQLSNKIADEPKRQQELARYLQLQNQVWEMEKFLNDYGMIWVGAKEDEASNVYLKEEEEPRVNPAASGPVLYPDVSDHNGAARESSQHQPQQSCVTESGESESHPIVPQPGQALPYTEVLPRKPQNVLEEDVTVLQDAQISLLASSFTSLEEPVLKGIRKLEHNMNNVILEVSSTLSALNYTLGQILHSTANNHSSSIHDPSQGQF